MTRCVCRDSPNPRYIFFRFRGLKRCNKFFPHTLKSRGHELPRSVTSRIEGSKVTCTRNFLIRIKLVAFQTVCTYEKSDTLIHWYGISLIQVQQAYSASRQCSLTRAHTTNKQLNPARVWRRASFERHSCARSEGVG